MKRSAGLSREKRVAVDVEGTRLRFAGRTRESVDWCPDLHCFEARVFEHLVPARTGQPAGNSAGPEVDVSQRLGRDRASVGDVGELQGATRSQHAVDLAEDSALVGA